LHHHCQIALSRQSGSQLVDNKWFDVPEPIPIFDIGFYFGGLTTLNLTLIVPDD
jgi:hypothetical protein